MIDRAGEKWGRLRVVAPTDRRVGKAVVWECRCDCGATHYATGHNLSRGQVKSCGCLRSARSKLYWSKCFHSADGRVGIDEEFDAA